MHIDSKEALRRLSSSSNLANTLGRATCAAVSPNQRDSSVDSVNLVPRERGGRGNSPNLSPETRDAVQTAALSGNYSQKDIASKFGIAPQTVSTCATGKTGGRPATEDAKAAREEKVNQVRDTALDKLMSSLGLIKSEDLAECKPTELARVAKDMAAVHRSLVHDDKLGVDGGVQLNVYVPAPRKLDGYKVIDV